MTRYVVAGAKGAVVRRAPSLSSAKVAVLQKGTAVEAEGPPRPDGRLAINAPVAGWLSTKVLEPAPKRPTRPSGSFRAFVRSGDRAAAEKLGELSWECRLRATTRDAPAAAPPIADACAVPRAEGGRVWGGTAEHPTYCQYVATDDRAEPLTVGHPAGGDLRDRHARVVALRAREAARGRCGTKRPCALGAAADAPLVSVVVCTYPPRHHLHAALYAMFAAQTYPRLELVVYDSDGAPSPFFAACADPRVRFYHEGEPYDAGAPPPRGGWTPIGAKRNALLGLARGAAVALFDDDNVYAPTYVAVMAAHLLGSGADLVRLRRWLCFDVTRKRFCASDSSDVRCESFVFLRDASKPGFDVSDDRGEEAGFFNARVPHDVFDDAGIFLKVHHGQNSSETPVTEDVPRGHVSPPLLAILDRVADLYAPHRLFTGIFADRRGYDAVSDVTLAYDVDRAFG